MGLTPGGRKRCQSTSSVRRHPGRAGLAGLRIPPPAGKGRSRTVPAPGGPLPRAAPLCCARRSHSRLREAGSREPESECGLGWAGLARGLTRRPCR